MNKKILIFQFYKKITVPNLLVIFTLESNFLDVPKSITFNVALLDFESKIRFSGFKSLIYINEVR